MTTLSNLTNEVTELADNDLLYVWDASTPGNPDGKMLGLRLRPVGSKITNYLRYEANITIPSMAAGVEADASIAVAGTLAGDHALFNLLAAPPANIAILAVWTDANLVWVRFRNTHASVAYVSAAVACTALVTRSVVP